MNRDDYKLLDRCLRKIDKLNEALEHYQVGYIHETLKYQLKILSSLMRNRFDADIISNVKYMRDNYVITDRYTRSRWVYYAWNNLKGYHDDAEIKRIRAKFWDYQLWKELQDIPY